MSWFLKCRMLMLAVGLLCGVSALADTVTIDGREWTYWAESGTASIAGVSPSDGNVEIPSSVGGYAVTSIMWSAFKDCSGLTSVTIPDSVTSIGGYAFCGCSGLTSVTIPKGVTFINYSAFKDCSGLTSVTIPDSVTSIGEYAFYGCSGLTSVEIPEGVTSIGEYAFYGCSGLTSVTIPEGVTSIGDRAFYNCSGLTSVTIPEGVTSIGKYAFYGCSGLTSVTIPDGVKSIGEYAFYGCSGLTSVEIPEGVTSIGEYAFKDCSGLTSVTIPEGVTSIGDRAFYGCSGLTSVTIPEGVTSIGNWVFYGCSGLTSVTIPEGVTSIGDWAFENCSGLTSVTIPAGVTSIGRYAFYGCSGLTSVTIPSSVTSIGEGAFCYCSGLTSVTIPAGVTSFGDSAFAWCSGLKSVTIPSSVTSIGDGAFADCYGLTSVTIPSSVTSIGDYAFNCCYGLTSVTIPEGVTSIGKCAFSHCGFLTNVTIPASVTSIGAEAFVYCSRLKAINFMGDAPTIGSNSFPSDAVLYVQEEADGWSMDDSGKWHGCEVRFYKPFSVTGCSVKYDGKAHGVSVSLSNMVAETSVEYATAEDGPFVADPPTLIDSGTLTVWCRMSTSGSVVKTEEVTVTVLPRTVMLKSRSASKVYDGSPLVNGSVTVGGDGFVSGEGATYAFTGSQTAVGKSANSFTYTLNTNTKTPNYNISTSFGTLTVTKATIGGNAGDVSVTGWTGKYDGAAHGVSVTVDDGIEGASVKYASAKTGPYSATPPTLTDAGTYTVWCEISAPGYIPLTNSATVSISPRSVTLTSASAAKVHDGSPLVNGTVTVGGDGFADGEGATYSVTGSQTVVGESANSFTYALNANTKVSNYNISTSFGTLAVTKAVAVEDAGDVSVTGWTGKYDGVAHGVSVSVDDGIAGATVKYASAKAGPYSATPPTLVDAGTMTVWCEISAPGYIPMTNSATVSVAKRAVTLTSAGASKVYDGSPLVNGTVTVGGDGFVSGEGVTYAFTGSQTAVGESANSFTYALNTNTKASNYNISTSFGTLKVTKATLGGNVGDVSVTGWAGKYDGAAHGVSVTVDDGIAGATVKYASAKTGPYSATPPTLVDAGTMTVWCEISAPGYIPMTNSARVFVAKRAVTLTSAGASKVYDGSPLVNGSVTVGGDGFVSGEGASFTVTGSQTAVGESANSFTYTLNTNTKASNYNISTSFGTLKVTKAASDVGNEPTVGDLAASDIGGVPTVSDLKVKSRAPWGLAIDYTVSGATEADTNAEPIVTATADGRTYTARNLFGATNCTNGAHRIYWNMLEDGIAGKVANGVVRVAYDNAPYCVIDLTGGTDALFYPASYLASAPAGGWTDEYKTTKLVLRRIEAGTFIMGSDQTKSSCRVTLTKPFYIGVFEVTQRQWELVMGTRPSYFTNLSCYASRPVEKVTYDDIRGSSAGTNWPASSAVDATSFLGKLRAKTGLDDFDLPTEAQWEYACRAGTTSEYNNGGSTTNDLNTLGRYRYNGGRGYSKYCTTENGTAAVGSYLPNAWGLYDMHGNVYEWCLDWHEIERVKSNSTGEMVDAYRSRIYGTDPIGHSSGSHRVVRGGSWYYDADSCASSYRGRTAPSYRKDYYGIRLVRTLEQ